MPDNEAMGFVPNPGAWSATPTVSRLAVRDHGLGSAVTLLMQSLPYALARFAILLGYTVACIVWLVVTFGGAAWLGTHIAGAFGVAWFVVCVVGIGWFWGAVLRYLLHLLACGHVAVLTDLITNGRIGNGSESQLAYGRRVVTERFGQVNALYRPEHVGARHPRRLPSHARLGRRDAARPRPREPVKSRQHRDACGDALSGQGDPVLQPCAQRRRTPGAAPAKGIVYYARMPSRS